MARNCTLARRLARSAACWTPAASSSIPDARPARSPAVFADVRPWRISRTVVMAPRLQRPRLRREGAVPAAYVAQQVLGWTRLDLDPLDLPSEQQAPTRMIRIRPQPGTDPTKGVHQHRSPFRVRPRSKRKRPARRGSNSSKCIGQRALIPSQQVHGYRRGLGQEVGEGRLLVHQPNHFAWITVGNQERRKGPACAALRTGCRPDADWRRHPAAETAERVPVLLVRREWVAVVDRHLNSSTRRYDIGLPPPTAGAFGEGSTR